jgi:hypothetical protein
MKKVLSVLLASVFSFGGSLPVLAGALPVNPGIATSNISTGVTTNTVLIGISAQSQTLALANAALISRSNLVNSLVAAGLGDSAANSLVDAYLSLIPVDGNGQASFGGALPGDVPGSVSAAINVNDFNAAIDLFNSIVVGLSDEQKASLGGNDVFLGISGFLRLR